MPKISSKGFAMPDSPIRKLVPYADKAEKKGVEIIRLNIGQPDIETPKIAIDAVKNMDISTVSYSHSAGNLSFREKLSAYYQKKAIAIDSDSILVTTGGSEALIFTINSIADPEDEIIIPEPFYANYYSFSTQSNVNVVPVISKIEDDFSLPKISDFEALITSKTKAILICNPGNPTGYLYSKSEIKQLAQLALKYDLFLISDEVYSDFVYEEEATHYSILQEPGLEEHAIVVDSFSKRYSMCGARIGMMISKNKAVIETAMKFAQARLSPPSLAQIACEATLDLPQSYFKEQIAKYKARRDTLIEGLRKIPNIAFSVPRGAFYCIVALPVSNSEDFAQWMLESFSLDNKTLMVAPADGFYSSPNTGKNQIRLAFVLNRNDLKMATIILGAALKAYIAKNKSMPEQLELDF